MSAERYHRAAHTLAEGWLPGLRELRADYLKRPDGERCFAAAVAFLGVQNLLWPLWLQVCREQGRGSEPDFAEYLFGDERAHAYPWFALFRSLSPSGAWVLVGHAELSDSRKLYQVLTHRDVANVLTSLDSEAKAVYHGQARDLLSSLGIFRSADAPLNLPLLRCEQLVQEWPRWRKSSEKVAAELKALSIEACDRCASEPELKQSFQELAAALWLSLREKEVISYGSGKRRSLLSMFGLQKRPDMFNGLMLLLGDHHALWQSIRNEV